MPDETAERAGPQRPIQTNHGIHTSNVTSNHFLGGQQRSWMLSGVAGGGSSKRLATPARPTQNTNTSTGDSNISNRREAAVNTITPNGPPRTQASQLHPSGNTRISDGRERNDIPLPVGPAHQQHKRPRLDVQSHNAPLYSFIGSPLGTYSEAHRSATSPHLATPPNSSPLVSSATGHFPQYQTLGSATEANGSIPNLPPGHNSPQTMMQLSQRRPSNTNSISRPIAQVPVHQVQQNHEDSGVYRRTEPPQLGENPQTGVAVQTPRYASQGIIDNTSTSAFLPRLLQARHDPRNGSLFAAWALQRFILLEEACKCNDWFYLVLHQIYCLRTLDNQGAVRLGVTAGRDNALASLEPMLLPNTKLSLPALQWFAQFPCSWQDLLQKSLSSFQHFSKPAYDFLDRLLQDWPQISMSCLARGYPPSPYELFTGLGMSSTVLQTVFFTYVFRQIEGGDNPAWVDRATQFFKVCQSQLIDKLNRTNQDLSNEQLNLHLQLAQYAGEYFALRNRFANRPQVVRNGPANIPGPQHISPAVANGISPSIPSAASWTEPRSSSTTLRHTISNTTGTPFSCTPITGVFGGLNIEARGNSGELRSPQSLSTFPDRLQMVAAMRLRQQDLTRDTTGHQSILYNSPTSFASVVPSKTFAYPQNSPSTSERAPTNRRRTLGAMPLGHRTSPTVSGGFGWQPFKPGWPKATPLIPPAGKIMQLSTHPNPNVIALHQAHLASPEPCIIPPNGVHPTEPFRLFQVLRRFVISPQMITPQQSYYEWQAMISAEDMNRKAKDTFPSQMGNRPSSKMYRNYREGSIVYRLRCIKFGSGLSEADWSTAATHWPSTCFVSLNANEITIRRKSHYGKYLPCDLTAGIIEGVNVIGMSVHFSQQEELTHTFAVAIEQIEVFNQTQCTQLVKPLDSSTILAAIMSSLAHTAESDDELAIVDPHISIDLIDPFTAQIAKTPVRGKSCSHRECFDLQAFLESRPNKHKGVLLSNADDWKCPICSKDARPQTLVLDGFLLEVATQIQAGSGDNGDEVRAIQVTSDGAWKPAKPAVLEESMRNNRIREGHALAGTENENGNGNGHIGGSTSGEIELSRDHSTPSKDTIMREMMLDEPIVIDSDDD